MKIYRISKKKHENNNDYETYMSKLKSILPKTHYKLHNLGNVDKYPVLLLTPKTFKQAPNLLVATGFHGNETAPIWAILKTIENNMIPNTLNISFLPLINPTGFIKNKRDNMFNENPNRGYAYNYGDEKLDKYDMIMSVEGKHIIENIKLIKKLAKTSLITMHEDDIINKLFIYTNTNTHTKLEEQLLKVGSKYFDVIKNGKDEENNKIVKGIIKNVKDGSFEDYMFRNGTPQCITTETPSSKNFNERVIANMEMLQTYFKYYENQ